MRAGAFGQLGLRDVRLVSEADGTPVRDGRRLLLTATHAGPGFFDAAHTGVWSLDPEGWVLEHRADLFFRRPDKPGAYGDNATHLVRDGGRWLVATSTWGDFDGHTGRSRRDATVAVTLADTDADLLNGRHVLDTRPLRLPTDGLRSVGVWDPHLVRIDGRWHVGFVSASRFFRFHPALAAGDTLDDLRLLGADPARTATEGTTLARVGGDWVVLASDGRQGPRAHRAAFPVFDLALRQTGRLHAPYPTNIPWPTVVETEAGWVLVTFDGTRAGGDLVGYGTHGDLVVMSERLELSDEQRLDGLAGLVDARLHGAEREVHQQRDLGVVELLDVAQHQRLDQHADGSRRAPRARRAGRAGCRRSRWWCAGRRWPAARRWAARPTGA